MEFETRPRIQLQVSASRTAPLVRALKRPRIPPYVWPTLFTSLGGFLWGFDTGSIGPIIVMSQFESEFGSISAIVQGLLVSSIIATAAVSSAFSGALSDRISRTYTISLGAFVFSVGSAIACSAKGLPQLFVGRCITGLGEGLFTSPITVYVMEISPTAMRGRAMTTTQLFNTVGVALGYFTCFGTARFADSLSWRFPLGMQAVVAIVLAIGTPVFPHSPHWLLSVSRPGDAEAATVSLGLQLTEIRKEDEAGPAAKKTFRQQAKDLWARDARFRTFFGLFLMGMQQLCGIDAVLYYAPVIFQQAGLSSTSASFLASGVSGIVMIFLTIASQFFQDRWARRTQMIGGGAVIAACMLTMGTLYASDAAQTQAGKRTLISLIYIFIAAFFTCWAIVIRLIASEIQRKHTRAPATSLAQCVSWAVNWIVAFSTPLFLTRSSSGPYFLFGGCSLLTTVVCGVFQPETKGLSLDVLDQGFEETKLQSAVKRYFGGARSEAGQSTGVELTSTGNQ